MRLSILFTVSLVLLSCSGQNTESSSEKTSDSVVTQPETKKVATEADPGVAYEKSTYDNPDDGIEDHRRDLKKLSDSSVFSIFHNNHLLNLANKHQAYFADKPSYQVVYWATGDLFQNKMEDAAFIVYDKEHSRMSILVYDESQNSYSELYRDIKVTNGLKDIDCNYSTFGTLDYQVANELIYHSEYLIKDPKKQIEYLIMKIGEITKDEDFILEEGCRTKMFLTLSESMALCIPTSSVYNNWECLSYDKANKHFVIFYGQAFAD